MSEGPEEGNQDIGNAPHMGEKRGETRMARSTLDVSVSYHVLMQDRRGEEETKQTPHDMFARWLRDLNPYSKTVRKRLPGGKSSG